MLSLHGPDFKGDPMCTICTDFIKGTLTAFEAKRNLAEIAEVLDSKHIEEVEHLIGDSLEQDGCEE